MSAAGAPGRSARKNAFLIMGAIMVSRVCGLVREMVLNAFIGPGLVLDSFYAAFRIPNLLRDLFAEGALSTAFVTVFSQMLAKEKRQEAFRLANNVLLNLCLIMTLICGVGMIFSPELVQLFNPGFAEIPGKSELTVQLTRLLFPFIALASLAAVFMGLLNSLGSFGLPASASTAFNVVSILTGLTAAWLIDPTFGVDSIFGFAIGTLLGGLAQWLILVPRAFSYGYRPAMVMAWQDPAFQQVCRLMVPTLIGGAAVQVNVLVNGYFASYLGNGPVSWLNSAFRLMQLPIGLFGVAIATVTLPAVAKLAAHEFKGEFRNHLSSALRQSFFLNFPAALGLFLLAEPVVRLVFQRGAFTEIDTQQTAAVLQAYVIGLAGYASIKVLSPTFAALNKAYIPMRVSMIGIFLNVGLNFVFLTQFGFGVVGLALATSMVAIFNFLQLAHAAKREVGSLLDPVTSKALLRIVGAATAMSVVVILLDRAVGQGDQGLLLNFVWLLGKVGIGGAVYLGTAWLLKVEELHSILRAVRRKVLRTS